MLSRAFNLSKTTMQNKTIEKKTNKYSTKSDVPTEKYNVHDETGIDLLEQNAKSISQPKKITNLNTDCMEIVFENLEFNDLVNVIDSSKEFYSAACQVYKNKYINMNVMFNTVVGGLR